MGLWLPERSEREMLCGQPKGTPHIASAPGPGFAKGREVDEFTDLS